jgi:hypothetical protein
MMVARDIKQMKSYDFAKVQTNLPTFLTKPTSKLDINEEKDLNQTVLLNKKISILKQNRYS